MSPIFVRPVREQLEHDRLVRYLVTKYKRKFEVAVNMGEEQAAPVKIGAGTFFPDLVLTEGKKIAGLVEVESGESVNNLEAMAQWAHFGKTRAAFHLYVPVQMFDAARRLCDANHANVAEIWTYRPLAEGFDLVRMYVDARHAANASKAAKLEKPKEPEKPAKVDKIEKLDKLDKPAKVEKLEKLDKPAVTNGRDPAKVAKVAPPARAAEPVKAKRVSAPAVAARAKKARPAPRRSASPPKRGAKKKK